MKADYNGLHPTFGEREPLNFDGFAKTKTMKRPLYALLVLVLFAPVYLCIGYQGFRPSWLSARIATVPVSVLLVVVLMAVFVALAWAFSGQAFSEDEGSR